MYYWDPICTSYKYKNKSTGTSWSLENRDRFCVRKISSADVQSGGLPVCPHCHGCIMCIMCAAWLLTSRSCLFAMNGFLGKASSPKRLNSDFAMVSTTFITGVSAPFAPSWFSPQRHLSVFPPLLSFSEMAELCSF